MAIVEKVRAQASHVASTAQRGAQDAQRAGKEKISEVQTRRRIDGLLRDLGAALYAEEAGLATDHTSQEISRLVEELRGLDEAGTVIDLRKATGENRLTDVDTVDPDGEFGLGEG